MKSLLRFCRIAIALTTTQALLLASTEQLRAEIQSLPNNQQFDKSVTGGLRNIKGSPKLVSYEAFGATWRTDDTFSSLLRLTNTLSDAPLTVTPVLYMADGFEYVLPPVSILAASVVEININSALNDAPEHIRDHLSTFGSASVKYKWAWQAALSGTVISNDVKHSLTFTSALVFPSKMGSKQAAQSSEGIYWLPFAQSHGFLSIYNASKETLSAYISAYRADGTVFSTSEEVVPSHGTNRITLKLPTLACGGVRVSYVGNSRTLIVNGGIEDYKHGFSSSMAFIRPMLIEDVNRSSAYTVSSSGLMNGLQDPMMGFPKNTSFKPFATLRNIGTESMSIRPKITTVSSSDPVSVDGTLIELRPSQVVHLDLSTILNASFSSSSMLNLQFDVLGQPNSFLASTGSVDLTGDYVFQVEPQFVGKTGAKQLPYWSTQGGFDTMITLWNPTSIDQSIVLTFFTASGDYSLPIQLKANTTSATSIKDLQASAPTAGPGLIFKTMRSGSALVSASAGPSSELNVVASVGTFDAQLAMCGTTCPTCLGIVDFWMFYDPFDPGLSNQSPSAAFIENEAGGIQGASNSSSWDSTNATVATSLGNANYQGNSIGGFVSTATLRALSSDHSDCVNGQPCPTDTFSDSSNPTVSSVDGWFSDGSLANAVSSWQNNGDGTYTITVSGPARIIVSDFQSVPDLALPPCTFPSVWCAVINGVEDAVTVVVALGTLIQLHNTWTQKVQSPIGWPGNDPNTGPSGWTPHTNSAGKPYYTSPDGTKSTAPDLGNDTEGPHWDYNDKLTKQKNWRIWPSGEMTPKKGGS